MSITWPGILKPLEVTTHPVPMNVGGPISAAGLQQLVGTDAGFWRLTLGGVPIRTADQVREWRWLVVAAKGGLEDIIVGVHDCRQAPRPIKGRGVRTGGTPHSDGALFSDGSGYSESLVRMSLHADAAQRATTITINIAIAGEVRRGMFFSIANRLYMVMSVPTVLVTGGAFGAGRRISFAIWPPLRSAASAGAAVEFGEPKATMRMTDPDSGLLNLRSGRFGDPSIDLVEAWDGF
jgi:hypothetical protein